MTKNDKQWLAKYVTACIESKTDNDEIVRRAVGMGFVKSTVMKYIKSFSKPKAK